MYLSHLKGINTMNELYSDIMKLHGLSEPMPLEDDQIEGVRKFFGAIPKSLETYYRLCGGCETMNSTQDILLTPDGRYGSDLENWDTDDYFIFYAENQCVSIWGFRAEDAEKDDPEVFEFPDMETPEPLNITLSHFLRSEAFMQAAFSFEETSEEFFNVTPEQIDAVAKLYPESNAGSSLYMGVRFFQPFPDTLIMVVCADEDEAQFYFASQSGEHYDAVSEALSGIIDFE